MPMPNTQRTYRLILSDDGRGAARIIEFEGHSVECALYLAQQQCAGREAELFEDDRSLGKVRCHGAGGFWMLSSNVTRPEESPGLASPDRGCSLLGERNERENSRLSAETVREGKLC